MQIKKISVRNFGPFEDFSIDFENMNHGIWIIDGEDMDKGDLSKNGIGKSMFYDAICYGIMGRSIESEGCGSKSLDDLVSDFENPNGKKKNKMVVEIEVDDLRIVRTRNPVKLEVYRKEGDGQEVRLDSTFGQEMIESHLGIDWLSFRYLFRFGGGETGMNSYAGSGVEFHRKLQDSLVQAGKLTECLSITREKIRDSKSQAEIMFVQKQELSDRKTSIENEIHQLKVKMCELVDAQNKKIIDIQNEIKDMDTIDDAYLAKSIEKEKIEKMIADWTIEYNGITESFNSYKSQKKQADDELKKYNDELSHCEEILSKLRYQYQARKDEANQFVEKMNNVMDEKSKHIRVISDFEILNEKRKAALENIEKLKSEKKICEKFISGNILPPPVDLEEISKKVLRVTEESASEKKTIGAYNDRMSVLKGSIALKNTVQHNISLLEEDIQKNISLQSQIASGIKCDYCQSVLTEEHVSGVKEKTSCLLKELNLKLVEENAKLHDIEVLENELADILQKKDNLDISVSRLDNDIVRLNREHGNARVDWISYNQQQKELNERKLRIDDISLSIVSYEDMVKSYNEDMSKIDIDIEKFDISISAYKNKIENLANMIRNDEDSCTNQSQKVSYLQGMIGNATDTINILRSQMKDMYKKSVNLSNDINSSNEKIAAFCDITKKPSEIMVLLEKKKNLIDSLSELQKNNVEVAYKEFIDSKNVELNDVEATISNIIFKMNLSDSVMPMLKFWENAFNNGIRPMVMSDMIPLLNSQVAKWMSLLYGHQVGVEFNNDMSLRMFNWDDASELKYSKLSSGMKMRVNLAVALSIRETIAIASGCNMSLFVSDESADSLDAIGMRGYAECLEEISKTNCVLVITHNPHMKECLESRAFGKIWIKRVNGKSYVSVA